MKMNVGRERVLPEKEEKQVFRESLGSSASLVANARAANGSIKDVESEGAFHAVDIVLKCQPGSSKAVFHYVEGALGPLLSPVLPPPELEPLYYFLL